MSKPKCEKCRSALKFKIFPFRNFGWFCPVCGKVEVESRRRRGK